MSRSSAPAMPRCALSLAIAALSLLLAMALAPVASADIVIAVTTAQDSESGDHERCQEGGECSLREALERVAEGEEAGVSGEVVVRIEAEGEIDISEEGELEVEAGEGVDAIEIEGPGESNLTIDAHGESRVVKVGELGESGELKISGLTITGGAIGGTLFPGAGGAGVYVENGPVLLEEVRVTENEIEGIRDGGGVSVVGSAALSVVGSRVDNNSTEHYAGGIFIDDEARATIERSEIDNNESPVRGGGIEARGELSVAESSIFENEATASSGEIAGGGIFAESPVTIVDSTIHANVAHNAGEGGGVNESEGGGGLALMAGGSISTSTVAGNNGGGILNGGEVEGATVAIEGSTVVGNTTESDVGAGLEGEGPAFESAGFVLESSVLAGNLFGGQEADCRGKVRSEGGNILGSSPETAGCEWEAGEGDVFETDPELEPLAQNGGPTHTMAPTSRESPVINKGEANGSGTDQRGFTRPVPEGLYDVGAVEVQAPTNESEPSISAPSEPVVGETISCEEGAWDTDTITDPLVDFQWVSGGETIDTGETHELQNSDAGEQLECEVEVDNGATSASARSQPFEFPPAAAQLSAGELDLGERRVGSEPGNTEAITVANTGGADLVIEAITSSDPTQFPLEASACEEVVAPRSSCEVRVQFAPTTVGPQSAELIVESNAPEVTAQLQGTGTEAEFSAEPQSFDFGEQRVGGTSAPETFEVANTGTASMEVGEVELGGGDPSQFRLSEDECSETTLEPGGECRLAATFVPTAAGPRSATIEVPGQAPGSIPLEGTGTEARISVAPPEADFGSQQIGSPPGAPQTFTLTSTGTAPLQVGAASIAGPDATSFAIAAGGDGCSGGSFTPGASCAVTVLFSPRAAGALTATLVLPGNAPASVLLAGIGAEPPPSPPPPPPPPRPRQSATPPAEALPQAQLLRHKGAYPVRGGKQIEVRLRCPAGGAVCQTSMKLKRGGRVVGRGHGKLGPGQSRAMQIRLTRRARRELVPGRRLRATLRITTAGRPTAVTTIVYRAPGRDAARRGHRHADAVK